MQALVDGLALQTDKGVVLAAQVIDTLRHQSIIIPSLDVVDRICAQAITRANRSIHAALTDPPSAVHRHRLDELLKGKDGSKMTWLT